VRPGIECDTLCEDWIQGAAGCQEVPLYGGVSFAERSTTILTEDIDEQIFQEVEEIDGVQRKENSSWWSSGLLVDIAIAFFFFFL